MNKEIAMRILDKVKEGVLYPDWLITRALKFTGDIDGHGTL